MLGKNFLWPAILAILSVNFPIAQADTNIYKYRSSEGGISYSQERSGSGELEAVIRVPATPKTVSQRLASKELQEYKEKADILASERRKKQQLEQRIEQEAQALALAEMNLADNLTPTPEERQTTVRGTSRLTDAYWMRIRAMQQSIELARARLQQASEDAAPQ